LPGNWSENTGSPHFAGRVRQYTGVVIKTDVGAIRSPDLLLGPYHNCSGNRTLLHGTVRCGLLDSDHNFIAKGSVSSFCTSQNADGQNFLCTSIVRDL